MEKKNVYRDLIILYCPEKVGSSSIASSIRISAAEKFMVFHTHVDVVAEIINPCIKIRVADLLNNNKILNPYTNEYRKIYVIDIFRTPIERKISYFFQKISDIHFNNLESNICGYPIEKIFKRFNDLFVHLNEIDYFNSFYGCEKIDKFDFESKYIIKEKDNVVYIKLRLQDSQFWGEILSNILKTKIHIIHDYKTSSKNIGELYNKFINEYKLPYNFYQLMADNPILDIYLTKQEKKNYLKKWIGKVCETHIPFTTLEYQIYKKISEENKFYCSNTANLHYGDDGCLCHNCSEKRKIVQYNIENNIQQDIKIRHIFDENFDSNIFLRLFPSNSLDEPYDITVNLVNS